MVSANGVGCPLPTGGGAPYFLDIELKMESFGAFWEPILLQWTAHA